jgi:hypothetical protein
MKKENFVEFKLREHCLNILSDIPRFSVRPSDVSSFEDLPKNLIRPATRITLRQKEVRYSDDDCQVTSINTYIVVAHSYDDVKEILKSAEETNA